MKVGIMPPRLNISYAKPMRLTDFSYQLPDELIARYPLAQRSASRLLHFAADSLHHRTYVICRTAYSS
jgi:hypothetical protein